MTEKQKAVYNALSTREYTAGIIFTERIDPAVVPRDEIYSILCDLQDKGLTELVYGQGWRAIETFTPAEGNSDERQAFDRWKAAIMSGATVLGYSQWLTNEAIKNGYRPEERK